MDILWLTPPIVFIIFLVLSLGLSGVTGIFATNGKDAPGKTRAYACGEDVQINQGTPEYGQFFEFAFFFTIMHVVVLIIATVPSGISLLSGIYLVVAALAIFILIRR